MINLNNLIFSKKKVLIIISILFFTLTFFTLKSTLAMQHYYKTDFTTGLVTASALNVRCGPSTLYSVITTVKKNEYIRVFAGIGDWYVIQTNDDFVGAVSKKYVKAIYPNASDNGNTIVTPAPTSTPVPASSSNLSKDEQEVFDLINQQRINNGLSALKIDAELQKVARIKAQEMVQNNYFAHESPVYGSPFKMMESFKISYKTAGENIAGNSSNSGAVNAWMNSPGHKSNILNNSFNYTGIGVVSSPKYGKIFVQMFIGK